MEPHGLTLTLASGYYVQVKGKTAFEALEARRRLFNGSGR